MISSVSAVLIAGLVARTSAHSSCGIGSIESVAHQTMTFVLPTITATVTKKSMEACTKTAAATETVTVPSPYPFVDDSLPFPGLLPVPDDIDLFEAYKKTVLSTKNDTLAWWYEGLSSVIPDGLPETPGVKSQTLQAFRVQHLSDTKLRADWHELIVLGEFQSGDDLSYVHNAQSGINNTAVANYYYDGPVTYYISKNAENNTLELEIKQPNTTVHRSTIKGRTYNGQIQFYQTEMKQRVGAPLPFTSTLRFISSLEDIRNPNVTMANGSGYYHFVLPGALPSLFAYPPGTNGTTHILGYTQKQGKTNEGYFPRQWATMKSEFPEWFNAAGEIAPDWTKVLTAAGLEP